MNNGVDFRAEAQAFNNLQRPQIDAYDWLLFRIDAALKRIAATKVNSVGGLEPPWTDPAVDDDRRNQMLFVSGGRGSGKTSILLSLQRDFLDRRNEFVEPKDPGAPANHKRFTARPGNPSAPEGREKLRVEAGRVVWLETLDLDPWPRGAQPMLAILARIEDAARKRLGEHGRLPTILDRGLLADATPAERCLHELSCFQDDVAISWEGNMVAHAGRLDADQYAVEVRRAEGARLDLTRRFQRQIMTLATHLGRGNKPCLFILPIDDFDLNPEQSFEVLRLVRKLASPHLLTIVLGDVQVAEDVFELVIARQLRDVGGLAPGDALPLLQARIGATSAAEIAANAVRKLLPPSQRFVLRDLTFEEALRFKPPGQPDSLVDLLGKVVITPSTASTTLRQFFRLKARETSPEDSSRSTTSTDSEQWQSDYRSAKEIIAGPTRHVMDLWLQLQHIATEQPDPRETRGQVARYLFEWARQLVHEDPALKSEERAEILRGLRWDSVEQEWEVRLDSVWLASSRTPPLVLSAAVPPPAGNNNPSPRCEVHAHKLVRWRFVPVGAGPQQSVADRTTASLKVLCDYMKLTGQGTVHEFNDAQIGERAFAAWYLKNREPVKVPWFISVWSTFRDFSVFATRWNEAREDIAKAGRGEDDKVKLLAAAWILAGAYTIFEGAGTLGAANPEEPPNVLEDLQNMKACLPDWRVIAGRIATVRDQLSAAEPQRARVIEDWIVNVALLLLPESGVWTSQSDVALQSELAAWRKDAARWPRIEDRVKQERARRLGEALLTPWGREVVSRDAPYRLSDDDIRGAIPQRKEELRFPLACDPIQICTFYGQSATGP